MRFGFNNHGINTTFRERLVKSIRRFVAHQLAVAGCVLDNAAYRTDWDEEFHVTFAHRWYNNHHR